MSVFWQHAGAIGTGTDDASSIDTTDVPIGAIYVRTDTDEVWIWDGGNWIQLT